MAPKFRGRLGLKKFFSLPTVPRVPRVPRYFTLSSPLFVSARARKRPLKPAAHVRKELSKMPREADSSAVSSRVRGSFGENFASRGEISNIKHVGYLRFRLARRNSHQNFTAHERKRLSYLPREACCSALSSRVRRA